MAYHRAMEKLTFRSKIGYASAAFGDAAAYALINTFLMFFLTTVAKIPPAAAGAITIAGALWNTLINPIAGYLSDNAATKWGRRRPFMFLMAVPMAAALYMLFTAVDLIPQIRPFYYAAILLIFWTAYTSFFVPFLALGAEYTQDYNERTELRSYASIFNMTGNLAGMVLPSIFVAFLCERGFSQSGAWSVTGGVVGICAMLSIWITVKAAKSEARISRYQLDDAKEKIELQVSQSVFKVNEAAKKLIMAEKNLEKADENLRYATLGFEEGVIPASNVLEAHTAWLSAQSEKIDAQIDVKLTEIYLKKATGSLNIEN